MNFFRKCECIRRYQLLISSNSLKRSFRKTSLSVLTKTTVVLTVLLAASIFETIIVIVVIKIIKNYLFKKFSFRNEVLDTLCKYKIKNRAASMLQGQVILKGRGGALKPFPYNFFRVYHFYIQKLLYPFQNCVVHLKKNYFFLPPQFYEKKSF